jgi:hypothetical protein
MNPGGATSGALPFTIVFSPLTLSSLSPSSATVGSGALMLTIVGQYFVTGATIQWTTPGGVTVQIPAIVNTPLFTNETDLVATVPASHKSQFCSPVARCRILCHSSYPGR